MIVDMRVYTFKPELMPAWVALYKEFGWPVQQKYLGTCVGWYTVVEGQLHRIVHMWQYESQADRETRRAAMAADPDWQDFVRKSQAMAAFLAQENNILKPADFFPATGGVNTAVILAAGMGTRMKSALPKAMQTIAGRPMLRHLLSAAEAAFDRVVVVIGPEMDALAALAAPHDIVIQTARRGTAHAALQARASFGDGLVAVLYADNPLVTAAIMQALTARLGAGDAKLVLLATRPPAPGQWGRVITDEAGYVTRVVEAADARAAEQAVGLCNAGGMVAGAADMARWLSAVTDDNAKGEFYLTDIIAIAAAEGQKIAFVEAPFAACLGVNSRAELAAAEAVVQARLRAAALEAGVAMAAPETVFFSADTVLAADVSVGPYVVFGPGVRVAAGAEIKAFSHLEACLVHAGAVVGPYARLRPGAEIGPGAHVGNFCEIKAASLGAGAKVNHLSYIGDAEIGAGTNIGAGTITCNYDGKAKHRTKIGARAFIGSNTALVAPIAVGDGALVAAGSTITEDVAAGSLAIARGRQVAKRRRG